MKQVGYIYAIDFGTCVKIGASRFPDKRVKAIAAMNGKGNPEYYVSVEVESHLSVETLIHKHLDDRKIFSETFTVSMAEAIEIINVFCEQVSPERKLELKKISEEHEKAISKAAEQILNAPKELVEANHRLIKSCTTECNEWLDYFGDKDDATDFLKALGNPIALMAVSNRIKAKAIQALIEALNGDDEKLESLGFMK